MASCRHCNKPIRLITLASNGHKIVVEPMKIHGDGTKTLITEEGMKIQNAGKETIGHEVHKANCRQ